MLINQPTGMRDEIALLGNVGCEELEQPFQNQSLIECWRDAMIDWGKGQVEDGIVSIYDEQGDLIEEYHLSRWEEYINSIDSINQIEECYNDLQWSGYCSFSDFLHGNLY